MLLLLLIQVAQRRKQCILLQTERIEAVAVRGKIVVCKGGRGGRRAERVLIILDQVAESCEKIIVQKIRID